MARAARLPAAAPPMAAAELHEEDAWGLQERSTAFYQQHNPERLEKVGWQW